VKVLENTFATPQDKEEDGILRQDLESPNEAQIRTNVVDFALKGEGELIVTSCAVRLGGLSTTPSSIIFVELSIVEFAVAAE
jgi:hypothetical protein